MSESRMPHHGGARHGTQRPTDIVVHDEEYPTGVFSAEAIGRLFASPTHGPSCAHYAIDQDSAVVCGLADEVLYGAPPNTGCIHYERDGYASYSAAQWNEPAAQRTSCRTAAYMARDAVLYSIPVVWVGAADLKAGRHGFQTHGSRSKAWGQSSHTDPGPNFPLGPFMALVLTCVAWCRDARGFQAAHGLAVDGDVGPATIDAMVDALFGRTPGDAPVIPAPVDPQPGPATYHAEDPVAPLGLWEKGPRTAALQRALGLPADGFFGLNTEAAVRQFQAAHGLAVDGLWGPSCQGALAPVVAPPAPVQRPQIAEDGVWGEATTRALQAALGVAVDGSYGPATKRALQARVGVAADGVVGPMTIRALQRRVGAPVDGVVGPMTIRALQAALNAGRF